MTLICVDCKRVYEDVVTVLPGTKNPGYGRCQKCRAVRGQANSNSLQSRRSREWQKSL